jgi:hypothetical protein
MSLNEGVSHSVTEDSPRAEYQDLTWRKVRSILKVSVNVRGESVSLILHALMLHDVHIRIGAAGLRREWSLAREGVMLHQSIAHGDDIRWATPALFNSVGRCSSMLRRKEAHAFWIGIPESVDRLIVVSHDREIADSKDLNKSLVRSIQVLKLIDQDSLIGG